MHPNLPSHISKRSNSLPTKYGVIKDGIAIGTKSLKFLVFLVLRNVISPIRGVVSDFSVNQNLMRSNTAAKNLCDV